MELLLAGQVFLEEFLEKSSNVLDVLPVDDIARDVSSMEFDAIQGIAWMTSSLYRVRMIPGRQWNVLDSTKPDE